MHPLVSFLCLTIGSAFTLTGVVQCADKAPQNASMRSHTTSEDIATEIRPTQTHEYEGTLTQGKPAVYKISFHADADSFLDVVVKRHGTFNIIPPPVNISVRATSDPNVVEQATKGAAEDLFFRPITGIDIYATLVTAFQQSGLCEHCRRTQTSVKHAAGHNRTRWVLIQPDATEGLEPIRYTLYVTVRQRKRFVITHIFLFLVFGGILLALIAPVVLAAGRARPEVYAMWGHFYFEELLSVPFLFGWKCVAAAKYLAFLWKKRIWRQSLHGTAHEVLMGSLESIGTSDEDLNAPSCRICRDTSGELITPCQCTGSMAYVHRACLDRWRTECFKNDPRSKKVSSCDVCLQPFEDSVQFKPGDLLQRFMHAQFESLGLFGLQMLSFWSFLMIWNLVTKFILAGVQCSAPWNVRQDVSVWNIDAFLQSFFMYGIFFGMFYVSALMVFVARNGQGRLYSVQSVIFASAVLGSFCYLSALVKFAVYLQSEVFVWDYEVKMMPGLLLGTLSSGLVMFIVRQLTRPQRGVERREDRV